ncbi:hypothetical protein BDP27DRAFT_1427686 [Rhodocollybia butyracea]|uniref:F-box domain-containing protein n=1 Tax=Rhodocollybia butyracea TaxID=206335 RepID=A0A9P5PID9_9AGAR|nr:hypothetical protein BDP27DRAFT_1427686 [Rhodocollybia butyracea]
MTNLTTLCLQCGYSAEDIIPRISPPTSRDNILCHSNKCLTEDKECTTRFFVTEGQLKLATLENRITLVKALLGELEVTKDELEVAISEKKKLLHPIRSFPTELLKEVFLHGAGFYSDAREHFRSGSHSLDVKAAPWLYGQVSHRWREVALSTPLLWAWVLIFRVISQAKLK